MKTTKNEPPMFRVTFARITGKDDDGKDVLGRPKEIGAVWARKNGKSGGILSLDLIPIELTQRQGVLFLVPTTDVPLLRASSVRPGEHYPRHPGAPPNRSMADVARPSRKTKGVAGLWIHSAVLHPYCSRASQAEIVSMSTRREVIAGVAALVVVPMAPAVASNVEVTAAPQFDQPRDRELLAQLNALISAAERMKKSLGDAQVQDLRLRDCHLFEMRCSLTALLDLTDMIKEQAGWQRIEMKELMS